MSFLIVNHLTNKTSECPLSAGDKAEGETCSGSGRHIVLFFSEHCLAMQQNRNHHDKVIIITISGQRALLPAPQLAQVEESTTLAASSWILRGGTRRKRALEVPDIVPSTSHVLSSVSEYYTIEYITRISCSLLPWSTC